MWDNIIWGHVGCFKKRSNPLQGWMAKPTLHPRQINRRGKWVEWMEENPPARHPHSRTTIMHAANHRPKKLHHRYKCKSNTSIGKQEVKHQQQHKCSDHTSDSVDIPQQVVLDIDQVHVIHTNSDDADSTVSSEISRQTNTKQCGTPQTRQENPQTSGTTCLTKPEGTQWLQQQAKPTTGLWVLLIQQLWSHPP